jgi:putative nucleotidyltransferase with HDIG domain
VSAGSKVLYLALCSDNALRDAFFRCIGKAAGTPETINSTPVIEAFIEKHGVVKALPENTSRILRMTSDKECNTAQLLKLISQDTALAASIMKAINSAFYALQTKVTRLDRAVALMGLRAVKEVTLSSCLSGLCKPVRLGAYDGRDLWDHSIAVAIMARELAVHSNALDPEEAFLAGMMHDIALLLAVQSEVELGTKLITGAETSNEPFIVQEQHVFGFNHCELGAQLGSKWNLAPQITAAIQWHHDPEASPPEHQLLLRHIYVADTLSCEASVGFPLTCKLQQVTDEMLENAKLTRDVATAVSAKLPLLLRLHLG